jgi:hypothetical protein
VSSSWRPSRIVSGGQTGVDRAALDVALHLGIPHGGWCPRGRRAEDGTIPAQYQLSETPSSRYAQRTAWNVRDSDATLVLCSGPPRGGTALTVRMARSLARPCLVADPADLAAAASLRHTLAALAVQRLNVAGPRESQHPGIGAQALAFLLALLEAEPAQAAGAASR